MIIYDKLLLQLCHYRLIAYLEIWSVTTLIITKAPVILLINLICESTLDKLYKVNNFFSAYNVQKLQIQILYLGANGGCTTV